jgi:adenylate cyclase
MGSGRENPALQAVLMALEMRSAIGALTEKWRRLGHDIGFGIGIAHGYATLGTIGFEGRFDYAAIGTVSNVASRLCDEAKPGQILISPRVLMAVEDTVSVEPVGEFELKGIRRPIAPTTFSPSRLKRNEPFKQPVPEARWPVHVEALVRYRSAEDLTTVAEGAAQGCAQT